MDMTTFTARLLLVSNCSARCGYCHNEGMEKGSSTLDLPDINSFLSGLKSYAPVQEVVLSGGEPSLHPLLLEIARLVKGYGYYVSMNSHGAHTSKILPLLGLLDELKIHIDSFIPQKEWESMRVRLEHQLATIERAKSSGVRVVVNSPLLDQVEALHSLQRTRELGVELKLIELLDTPKVLLSEVEEMLIQEGYENEGSSYLRDKHRVSLKHCSGDSIYLTPTGVRVGLKGREVPLSVFMESILTAA